MHKLVGLFIIAAALLSSASAQCDVWEVDCGCTNFDTPQKCSNVDHVAWAQFHSVSFVNTFLVKSATIQGSITLPTQSVGVTITVTGTPLAQAFKDYQQSNQGTNYWTPKSDYQSAGVDAPSTTDIIRLSNIGTVRITFTQATRVAYVAVNHLGTSTQSAGEARYGIVDWVRTVVSGNGRLTEDPLNAVAGRIGNGVFRLNSLLIPQQTINFSILQRDDFNAFTVGLPYTVCETLRELQKCATFRFVEPAGNSLNCNPRLV